MGKGQRSRLARADEMAAKKVAAKKKAKQEKITRVISIVAAIVLVVAVAGMITYTTIESTNRQSGTYLKNDIALESANYTVTNAQQMYFFQNYYSSFVSSNSDSLSYFGLDTSKSLKEQTCPYTTEDGKSMTWYEYFMDATVAQVEQTMVLAEAAREAGVTLSEDDQKNIESTLSQVTPENFAPGLTSDDVKACLEMAMLAANYQTQVTDAIEYTDADIEKYYTDNKNNYDMVDYRMYSFNYADEEDKEDDGKTMTKAQAKAMAEELAATGTEEAFVAWLSDYFTNTLKIEADRLEGELNNTKTVDFAYTESYKGIDFLFGSDTAAGDIKVIDDESSSCYKVFMLLTPRHRDESTTKSVRHILISVDNAEDKDAKAAAKAKAEKLLADWKAGEATEDSFAALVHDNTDDTGSKENGGLYENFPRGQMVATFEDWAYDPARVTGDTGIVETEYGYHIMYFIGDGNIVWKGNAEADYVNAEYSEKYTEFAEKYTITVNQDKIEKIASYVA
ncbi:MAG: peptidylprolyl isomerase [Clostridia bacterium]|nr:peptidylprolyl isomerase [Clostridia bacterium]